MTLTLTTKPAMLYGMTDDGATSWHGTATGYSTHKCRCDQCKAYKRGIDKANYERNKEARKEAARRYYAENRDTVRQTQAQYRADNAEVISAKARAAYLANPEAVKARATAWKKANPERTKELAAAYRERNRELIRTRSIARYYELMKNDPEKVRKWRRDGAKTPQGVVTSRSARHKRRGAPLTAESKAWWLSLVDPLCTYCGDPATTIDHIIPLSKGGSGKRENLTPACKRCNSRKNQMSVEDFLLLLRKGETT